jgi:hypothetical protein
MAHQSPSVSLGHEIRVKTAAEASWERGLVSAVNAESLTLRGTTGEEVVVPLDGISVALLRRGKKRNVGLGAGLGLLAGIVLFGSTTGDDAYQELNAAALGVAGVLLGAVVGFFVRTDRWEALPLPLEVAPRALSRRPSIRTTWSTRCPPRGLR